MLNIKIVFILVLIVFSKKSFSQEYRTYTTGSIPYHIIEFKNDTLNINIPKGNIFSCNLSAKFLARREKDTVFIFDKIASPNNQKEGVRVILGDLFTNQFINKKIVIKSNNELIINDRPYFKKEFVFDLIGDNKIYYIYGKLFKVPNNSDTTTGQNHTFHFP